VTTAGAVALPAPSIWRVHFNSSDCDFSTIYRWEFIGLQGICVQSKFDHNLSNRYQCVDNKGLDFIHYFPTCKKDSLKESKDAHNFTAVKAEVAVCITNRQSTNTSFMYKADDCYDRSVPKTSDFAKLEALKPPPLLWAWRYEHSSSCMPLNATEEITFHIAASLGECFFAPTRFSQRFESCDTLHQYRYMSEMDCNPIRTIDKLPIFDGKCQQVPFHGSYRWHRTGCSDREDAIAADPHKPYDLSSGTRGENSNLTLMVLMLFLALFALCVRVCE
jgi:hypothetical protein